MRFRSVLIANRGEIACRIMRTLKEMGLRSIAVYSDADRDALHVRLADDAVYIGASAAAESYLNIDKIMKAAKSSGAQAIHPGYGFLSESAAFARACKKVGLTFIGPSADAIELMGDKAAAKRHMMKAGVRILPGYQDAKQDDPTLIKEAKRVGFPLMVKAAAGGGGRGMRLVSGAGELQNALSSARAEALSAFGSDTLILERALVRPRHVELQVFGDAHGNIIHLGERDCSVQRRHQKILEEAPCPVMTEELRVRMGEAAVKAAKSVDYVGAGTVEFLLDEKGDFFFLEMNTRLQVEHPVTEAVTGLDLVALQICVAQGEELGVTQDNIKLTGHAIEARLYAEDPAAGFLPATGQIAHVAFPDNVRVDSGVAQGSEVSPFYDPMIAKLIASGPDRETARRKLIAALEKLVLFGVPTNRQFLIDALRAEPFAACDVTTAFIDEVFSEDDLAAHELTEERAALAGLTHYLARRDQSSAAIPQNILGWSSAHPLPYPIQYEETGIEITAIGAQEFKVKAGETLFNIVLEDWRDGRAQYKLNERRQFIAWHMERPPQIFIQIGSSNFHLTNELTVSNSRVEAAGRGDIRAPMHGALTDIFVKKGQVVALGARLAVVEAMKMQHDILADISGEVTEVFAKAGTQVAADAPLFKLES